MLDSFKSTYGRYSFAALVHFLLMGFKVPSVLNLPLTMLHIGQAVKENPGYLKLRKIRAAQRVAHVVSFEMQKLIRI